MNHKYIQFNFREYTVCTKCSRTEAMKTELVARSRGRYCNLSRGSLVNNMDKAIQFELVDYCVVYLFCEGSFVPIVIFLKMEQRANIKFRFWLEKLPQTRSK